MRDAIATPGPFAALLHDDLVNGRQAPIRHGRMVLLDFENAKFGHALLDPARILMGKFERDLDQRDMVCVYPAFGVGLLAAYRTELVVRGAPSIDDHVWDTAVGHAVAYTTVALVGRLLELAARTSVRGGLLVNVRAILGRAAEVLDGNATWAELAATFELLHRACTICP